MHSAGLVSVELLTYSRPVVPGVGDEPRLLTIQGAAERLGVTRPAVHQMLDNGRLVGPQFPDRAPAGVGRVTVESVDALRAHRGSRARAARRSTSRVDGLRREVRELRSEVTRLSREVSGLRSRQPTHDDQLLRMKIAADEARSAARQARQGNRDLLRQLSEAVKAANAAYEQADTVDTVAEHYSATLTSLLIPDDPSDLRGDKEGLRST